MKLSQMGIGKDIVTNIDEQFPVQDILAKTGQLYQYSSGIYALDNVPFLLKKIIKEIISEELTKVGCVEVTLPVLQPESIWEESGRLEKYVEENVMFRTNNGKSNFCLAPTAEEAMLTFARNRLSSYKSLPVTFFQIGEKFRNELRARGYLLRGKSFEMMDAYSFNHNSEELNETYENIKQAYFNIFERLGFKVLNVGADSGSIGGKKSEEFMIVSDLGEDTILVDDVTGKAINTELLEREDADEYLKEVYGIEDTSTLKPKRSLELGHIFQLGTKYSETMNANFTTAEGTQEPFVMGCYGIGVSRVLAAVYENNVIHNKKGEVDGVALPVNISPYIFHIIPKADDENKYAEACKVYKRLMENSVPVLFDDRDELNIGGKIKDAKFLGTPYIAVFGSKTKENEVEVENCKTGERTLVTVDKLIQVFTELNTVRRSDKSVTFETIANK